MKDREIVELFWKRSPQAVDALAGRLRQDG